MAKEPKEPKEPDKNKHEKEDARDDKAVPPGRTPNPNEPKPGKRRK